MKTNYQRNFIESRKSRKNTLLHMNFGSHMQKKLVEIGEPKLIGADFPGWDHANGHRGTARSKYGAKKFIRSRLRFNENNNLRTIVKEL